MKKFYAVSLAVLASVILCFAVSKSAEAVVVKGDLEAAAVTEANNCPGEVRFNGTIMTDGPATVEYFFEGDDGVVDEPAKTLVFDKADTKKLTFTKKLKEPHKGLMFMYGTLIGSK